MTQYYNDFVNFVKHLGEKDYPNDLHKAKKKKYKKSKLKIKRFKEIDMKLTDIKPNPNNPRLIKDEKFKKLCQSLKDFPEMLELRPIVVNKDHIILGGNMRYKAAKEIGLKEIPVKVADNLTPEQEREFLIKDNTSGGEWDWEVLANEWNSEELETWGLDIPAFDINNETELDDLSNTIKNLYRIEIICKDEEHQENTYNKLIEQGHECRLLTL